MRRQVTSAFASIIVIAAVVTAPALAAPDRKTELVDMGKPVDSLLLRYRFESVWVLDGQTVLLRDSYRDHYLVTLARPCEWMDRSRAFHFFPKLANRVRASLSYELRDDMHENCDVAKLEKISGEAAREMIGKLG